MIMPYVGTSGGREGQGRETSLWAGHAVVNRGVSWL